MDAVKDIADPIPSENETPPIEFRIDIDRATLEVTTYAAVAFHVIEGPFQDCIHEQTVLDRQPIRIQLGIDVRIVVTECAVLYQDIRGIEHIDCTGGFIPTVMIKFKAINLHVIACVEDNTAIKTAHMNNVALHGFLKRDVDSFSIGKDSALNAQLAEGTDLIDRSILKMVQLPDGKETSGPVVTFADDCDGMIIALTWGTENTCSV